MLSLKRNEQTMKAVILVGGQGTRLRPLTCNMPKATVPLLNRPYLEHLLSYLKQHGVDDIILAMGYNPDPIKKALGDGSYLGIHLMYLVEDSPLGTAGAVKNAESFLDDTFVVFNGDILTDINLSEMIKLHKKARPKVSIALTPVDNPTIYGVIETDSNDMVHRFVEKPSWSEVTTNMINAGLYIIEPEVLQRIPPATRYMFEHHLFPGLLGDGESIYGYKSNEYWIDIGTPQKYLKAHYDLMGKLSDSVIKPDKTVHIHENAVISGQVLIGNNSVIGAHSQIHGPAVIGSNCHLSQGVIFDKSVLWQNCVIGEKTIVKDCIIANRVTLENNLNLEECVIGDDITLRTGDRIERGASIWPESCSDSNGANN